MLPIFLAVVMVLPVGQPVSARDSIETLRTLFWKSGSDNQAITSFYRAAENARNSDSPVSKGYFGVATMMRARITGNPFKKWYYFNKGKVILERAIDENPDLVELRFLRLSVQSELPVMLDYYDSIKSDRTFIMNHLSRFMRENQANEIFGLKIAGYLTDENLIGKDQISTFSFLQE